MHETRWWYRKSKNCMTGGSEKTKNRGVRTSCRSRTREWVVRVIYVAYAFYCTSVTRGRNLLVVVIPIAIKIKLKPPTVINRTEINYMSAHPKYIHAARLHSACTAVTSLVTRTHHARLCTVMSPVAHVIRMKHEHIVYCVRVHGVSARNNVLLLYHVWVLCTS